MSLFDRHVALLVGIGTYLHKLPWDELGTLPGRDVDSVRKTLLRVGYHDRNIYVLKDHRANWADVVTLADSITRSDDTDLVLLFWIGHGFHNEAYRNFLIPYDGKLALDFDGMITTCEKVVFVDQLIARVVSGAVKNVAIFLDSCYSAAPATATLLQPCNWPAAQVAGRVAAFAAASTHYTFAQARRERETDPPLGGTIGPSLCKALLNGDGAGSAPDGTLTLGELIAQMQRDVGERGRLLRKPGLLPANPYFSWNALGAPLPVGLNPRKFAQWKLRSAELPEGIKSLAARLVDLAQW